MSFYLWVALCSNLKSSPAQKSFCGRLGEELAQEVLHLWDQQLHSHSHFQAKTCCARKKCNICTNFYAPTSMHQLYMLQLLCTNYMHQLPTSLQASKIRNYYPPSEWVTGGRYTGEILAHLKTQRVPQNSCCVSSCPEKPNMYTIYLIYFYIFMWHILHLYVFIATSICPECALSCIDLH